jgi:hypothetical protein
MDAVYLLFPVPFPLSVMVHRFRLLRSSLGIDLELHIGIIG